LIPDAEDVMPQVIDWRTATDPHEVGRLALQSLKAGKIVAFPTETVYGLAASATIPEAVERLCHTKGRPNDKPLTVAVPDPATALEWVPDLGVIGRRLARRCWPGPLTLVSAAGVERGRLTGLPEAVRNRVAPRGTVGLRVPAHAAILDVLRDLPIVLTSANVSGQPAAVSGTEVLEAMAQSGDDIELLIDDGRTLFGQSSTVVEVMADGWRILREGALSESTLRRQSACIIDFVCTGNTCRSPMAEALCKKMLAETLGCTIDELPDRGYIVTSSGIAASHDCAASPEAEELIRAKGGDLSRHRSQPITLQSLHSADHILAMTRAHLAALHHIVQAMEDIGGASPEHAGAEKSVPDSIATRLRLLDPQGLDIPDPLGGEMELYRECAQAIENALTQWLAELPR
jgi:protein-tyrosine phosphatase